ncbi:MAG: glutathione S-transferase family protein [Rhodobiaceae bacterium]|nr:glutathione S-transferase family protein [Rhodobiaceae bacterium]
MTIEHTDEFELYHYGESLCSQMVRLALEEKQIPYKSHHMHLELNAGNLTKEFRKINPSAVVPVLVHKGTPIYDSWEILKYLDQCAPEQGTPLWPKDEESQKVIDAVIMENALDRDVELGENFGTSVAGASTYILANILRRRPALAVIWDYFVKHPMKERAVAFTILRLRGGLPDKLYKKFIRRLAIGLLSTEKALDHGKDYMFGDYSMIDTMMTAHFHRLEDVALGDILQSDELPNIKAYWMRLQARPSYEPAMLAQHSWEWREAMEEVYGGKPSPYFPYLKETLTENRSAA